MIKLWTGIILLLALYLGGSFALMAVIAAIVGFVDSSLLHLGRDSTFAPPGGIAFMIVMAAQAAILGAFDKKADGEK